MEFEVQGASKRLTVPLCPVDGAPGDQGQEERREAAVRAEEEQRLPSVTVKTWNNRPVRDL